MQIILGSTSPYKKQLLAQLGVQFSTADSGLDEERYHQATVRDTVRTLSELKAQQLLHNYTGTETLIITADVAGELDGKFLGKPKSLEQARTMLTSYSDRAVNIWCGTTVANSKTGVCETDVRVATIHFNNLTSYMIEQYLQSQNPLDKGGALAIETVEHLGWVKQITGEYNAIIGLSLEFITIQLKKYGILPA